MLPSVPDSSLLGTLHKPKAKRLGSWFGCHQKILDDASHATLYVMPTLEATLYALEQCLEDGNGNNVPETFTIASDNII